jgi:hypothetical protein
MIIHHTSGSGGVDGVISTFKERNFPAQFVIDRDGQVYQTLPDGARGQHIRNGSGKGAGLSNANTEGVEIIAKNDKDVTPAQRDAAIALVQQRAAKWGYDPKTGVFGHGEVNPGHKEADEGMTVVSAIRNGATAVASNQNEPAGQPYKVASVGGIQAPAPGGEQAAPPTGDQPAQPVQVAQAQPERKPTKYDAMDPLVLQETLKQLRGVRNQFDVQAEKARKLKEDEYLKEAFSRASKGELTGDYIETIRPYIGHTEYKGLLKTMGGDDAVDDPSAIVELTTRVDELSPPEYQKLATSYLNQNKLKTSTYITLSEKNRSANKDDAPASPFKSGRDFVKSNLDTAPFTDPTGVITAQVKAALAQGLSEYDIWAEGNPRATREDAMKKANEVVKLTRPLDINLRLTTPLSRYFGNKTRGEINIEDVDTAELALANEIRGGSVTNKADIDLQIRRLQTWRELISRSQTGQPGGR